MSTIRTLDRAFSILKIVANHPNGVGVSAVATELGLAKSTISRLLATMNTWEIVKRTDDNRYQIGSEPIRWAGLQPFTATLSALARPALNRLSQETGEASAICLLKEFQVFYLDQVQGHHDIQVRDWTGEQLPAYNSAAGMVMLAYSERNVVEMFFQQLKIPATEQDVFDPIEFRKQLATVKEEGYSIADELYAKGVMGLAVPIFNHQGSVESALNVYGPKFRLNSNTKCLQIIQKMKIFAKSLKF